MRLLTIDQANLEDEHICCALGGDPQNRQRAQTKKDWLKERFREGLVFRRFDERGKLFIEYMPVEKVWKPIIGQDYFVINCLWVAGKFKGTGLGRQLLDECLSDATARQKKGIAVVTSTKKKPYLTEKSFFIKHGFITVDTAPPYFELLALKLDPEAPTPVFSEKAKTGQCANKSCFTLIYSNQCPFTQEYIEGMSRVLKKKNLPHQVIRLTTYREAQELGSPFGTCGIYFNGELRTHELMSDHKFEKFVDGLIS